MSSKWYVVTVKIKGIAKSTEDAKERCKLMLRYITGIREENIEIVNVEELKMPLWKRLYLEVLEDEREW